MLCISTDLAWEGFGSACSGKGKRHAKLYSEERDIVVHRHTYATCVTSKEGLRTATVPRTSNAHPASEMIEHGRLRTSVRRTTWLGPSMIVGSHGIHAKRHVALPGWEDLPPALAPELNAPEQK